MVVSTSGGRSEAGWRRVLRRLGVDLRRGEGEPALLLFVFLFLLLTFQISTETVRQSTFIDSLGAANLPWVYLLVALTSYPFLLIYNRFIGTYKVEQLLMASCLGAAALMVGFWGLMRFPGPWPGSWVAVTYYVFTAIVYGLLNSQFWLFANHLFDPRQAKRLFGFIGAGALLGGIGDLYTRFTTRVSNVAPSATQIPRTRHSKWFRILDLYVIRAFVFFFLLIALAFASLVVVVTLFELLPDIVENDARIALVVAYFFYYIPQILYLVTPLAVLVAVFITLGSLTRTNETLAVRAGAISLYRIAWPLVAVAILLSMGVYFMGDYMLPYTNQRQDAFRDTIKGRAPQTYLDPGRKWMVGSNSQIYFYNYFEPSQNSFSELSIFEFDPGAWSLNRMTFAALAGQAQGRWNLEAGWTRTLTGQDEVAFQSFEELSFERPMDPPNYFKREVRIASQMNYPELRSHVDELRTAGFEVNALTVDLYTKLSFPLASLIMSMIAIPFALSTGRRGAFYGIGIAILIGISYWAAIELFGKLGGISQISPVIAAWFPHVIFGLGGVWMLLKVRT